MDGYVDGWTDVSMYVIYTYTYTYSYVLAYIQKSIKPHTLSLALSQFDIVYMTMSVRMRD